MGNAFWDAANSAFQQGQAQAQAFGEIRANQVNREAGDSAARGDYGGAANAFFRAGQYGAGVDAQNQGVAQAKAAREQHLAQIKDQSDASMSALRALRTLPQAQRGAYFANNIAPILRQRGVPDEGINHIGSIAGDDHALDAEAMALGQAATKFGFSNIGGDLYRTNPDTGAVDPAAQGYRAPKYVTPPAGTTATLVDPGRAGGVVGPGGTVQPLGGQPAGVAPPPTGLEPPNAAAPQPSRPLASASDIQAIVRAPVQITSGARTPEHNAAVGGVANSRHLTDQARDFVPRGISTAEAATRLRAAGYHAIDEGTHVHVDWGGQARRPVQVAQNGPPQTIQGPPKADPNEGSVDLTPATVDYVAQQYMLTGTLPPLGMGKTAAANRDRILNRAAAIEGETGATGADAVMRHLAIKSAASSLNNITKIRDQVAAFEITANRNADLVLQLAPKGAAGSVPVINRWIQHGRQEWAGDTDVTNFNAAIQGFVTEYGKIISGATGGAVTSDSARREALAVINGAMSEAQLRGVIGTLRTEMKNRMVGLDTRADLARETIRNGGVAPPPGADHPTSPASVGHPWPSNQALDDVASGKLPKAAFEARYGPVTRYQRSGAH